MLRSCIMTRLVLQKLVHLKSFNSRFCLRRLSSAPQAKDDLLFGPTIYALSTAPSRAAIGVIRVSGPASTRIYQQLTREEKLPKPRYAVVRKLFNPSTRNFKHMLDECVVLYFPGPKSYTGEDLLELQCHGGNAVINAILKAIESLHTQDIPIRYAEAGEFSKRAFQNGRFDLTEIEGINDLIHAETESQRVSSLDSMQGKTKELFFSWREEIVKNVALLATVIDFGEDHDIDEIDDLFNRVDDSIRQLETEIKDYLDKVNRSEILMNGIKLTLLGPPNAGKSSLLNVLANSETAIVSDIAGTTRDVIDIPLDINGYKVIIGDTAGIRSLEDTDSIEKEGIKRAKSKSLAGDIVLVMLPCDVKEIDQDFVDHVKQIKESNEVLVVLNKSDLLNGESDIQQLIQMISQRLDLPQENFQMVSCTKGDGIAELMDDLTLKFKDLTWSRNSDPIVISRRAKDIIVKDVLFGFDQFYETKQMDDIVLASEALKHSVHGIGKITGQAIGIEEVLGVVFSSFCIGK